jgi:[acyl-carrier-protein] S-malonyltransferase
VASNANSSPNIRHSCLVLAIVAPGQGAQTPGFLSPWLTEPRFADRLNWLSIVAGLDLAHYGTQADAETIRDTAIAQPLLVVAGLLAALELFPQPADGFQRTGVAAGHSVGEITAAAAVGVLSAEQAMVLVRERGQQMATASAARATSMMAIIGGDPEEVLAAIEAHGLTAANNNGSGQIVAAGTVEQLAALQAAPPAKARLIQLSVAGAFHTVHMEPAVAHLSRLSRAITTHDPRTRLLSNADGQVVQSGREYLTRLVNQVANPVRWDLCLQTMADLGVTGLLELPPAGTLTGIAKRNLKGIELFNLNTPDQIPAAQEFVAKHGDTASTSAMNSTPSWMLLVSPGKGEFHASEGVEVGGRLSVGAVIGTVANSRDTISVSMTHPGTITEWLVEDGDRVAPGQPLIRLYPAHDSAGAAS